MDSPIILISTVEAPIYKKDYTEVIMDQILQSPAAVGLTIILIAIWIERKYFPIFQKTQEAFRQFMSVTSESLKDGGRALNELRSEHKDSTTQILEQLDRIEIDVRNLKVIIEKDSRLS